MFPCNVCKAQLSCFLLRCLLSLFLSLCLALFFRFLYKFVTAVVFVCLFFYVSVDLLFFLAEIPYYLLFCFLVSDEKVLSIDRRKAN